MAKLSEKRSNNSSVLQMFLHESRWTYKRQKLAPDEDGTVCKSFMQQNAN